MKIPIRFSESAKRTFNPVPPRWYNVEISDAVLDQAITGTEFLNVEFKIFDPVDYENRRIWTNFYLTEEASWRLAALQNAVGIEPGSENTTEDFIGKRLRIRVKEVEDQEGNLKSEVVAFRRLPSEKVPF